MRKLILLVLILLMLPMTVGAAADVQSVVDELPAVDVLQKMDMEAQREIYDKTQAAYDAYMALSEDEKAEVEGAEETFEALFGYFNTLVAPAEEAEQAESGTGSEILSTAIACLIGIFLAQKIITKRNLK